MAKELDTPQLAAGSVHYDPFLSKISGIVSIYSVGSYAFYYL